MKITLSVLFFLTLQAFADRFPASIKAVEQSFKLQHEAHSLEHNSNITNTVRKELIARHLSQFKKAKSPSAADFKALQDDLEAFLRVDSIVKKVEKKQKRQVFIPQKVAAVLDEVQQTEMQKYFDEYNQQILPQLYRGIVDKDKAAVVSALEKWDKNNQAYVSMVRKFAAVKKAQIKNKKI